MVFRSVFASCFLVFLFGDIRLVCGEDEPKEGDPALSPAPGAGELRESEEGIEREVDKTGLFRLGKNGLRNGAASSSSENAERAIDGDPETIWRPGKGAVINWWEGRLSEVSRVRRIAVLWERAHDFPYIIEGSADGDSWEEVFRRKPSGAERDITVHTVDVEVGYLRLSNPESGWVEGIREIGAFDRIRDVPFHVVSEGVEVLSGEAGAAERDGGEVSPMPAEKAFALIGKPDRGRWGEAFSSLARQREPGHVDRLIRLVREGESGRRRQLAISTLGDLYRDREGELWQESPKIEAFLREGIGRRGVDQRELFKTLLRNSVPVGDMNEVFAVVRDNPSLREIGVDLMEAHGAPYPAVPWLSRVMGDGALDDGLRWRAAMILAGREDGFGLGDAFDFALALDTMELSRELRNRFVETLVSSKAWEGRTEWLLETVRKGGTREKRLAWEVLLEGRDGEEAGTIGALIDEVKSTGGGTFVALIEAIGERGGAHFESLLEDAAKSDSPAVSQAAREAKKRFDEDREMRPATVAEMNWPARMEGLGAVSEADTSEGKAIFEANCGRCHSGKGPGLASVTERYPGTRQLVEAILNPDAEIAEGFPTEAFTMQNGKRYRGFVGSENEEGIIELVDQASNTVLIRKSKVERRVVLRRSTMPANAAADLTLEELAHLLAYLRSLE